MALQCRPWSVLVLNKDVPLLGALMIGLKLRFVMREWTDMFRILAEGANAAVETKLKKLGLREATGLFLLGTHRNGWLFWRHENDHRVWHTMG